MHEAPDVCYLSAPYRGLGHLLACWPDIRKEIPEATLRCAYGWQVFDAMALQAPDLRGLRKVLENLLQQDGVTWMDRLPQRQVRDVLDTSKVWAYPCDYSEMLCSTAVRAQARQCYPVVVPRAALSETVMGGTRVDTPLATADDRKAFAAAVVEALRGDTWAERAAVREHALRYHDASEATWRTVLKDDGLL